MTGSGCRRVCDFRILDMWKPWPIRSFDCNVHGGMGIMIDDIVAGVISAGILDFIGHHWPLGFCRSRAPMPDVTLVASHQATLLI
ncbi:phosphatidylglycerophosphatase A [Escherichia coli]